MVRCQLLNSTKIVLMKITRKNTFERYGVEAIQLDLLAGLGRIVAIGDVCTNFRLVVKLS